MRRQTHQYIERSTRRVRTEQLHGDKIVCALYAEALEHAPWLCRIASSAWVSSALAFLNYDLLLGARATGTWLFLRDGAVDLSECVDPPHKLDTPRKVFERQIRYWECRPLPKLSSTVVCPADSRALVGSLRETSHLYVKGKFFEYEELLGSDRHCWLRVFNKGDFAIFRLTPEKYHYTHAPVSGKVLDIYEIHGNYHSCNPGVAVSLITPHSKNRRVVTILETDVPGGTGVGRVAIIEVVALMIGQIHQCYSTEQYRSPQPVRPGLFLERGQPKSLFRPGSSTVILLFQPGRIRFAEDVLDNLHRCGVESRFSRGFGQTLVETDVEVRSLLAYSNRLDDTVAATITDEKEIIYDK